MVFIDEVSHARMSNGDRKTLELREDERKYLGSRVMLGLFGFLGYYGYIAVTIE